MARWRVGNKLGHQLYRDEIFVGTVGTSEIAAEIVETMNAGREPDGDLEWRVWARIEIERMREALQRIEKSTRPGRNIHALATAAQKPHRGEPR